MTSTALFTVALGLQPPWKVAAVAFAPEAGRLDLGVGCAAGRRCVCPHCGAEHQPGHDTQERVWRHLNFCQYQAYRRAQVPRVRCAAGGKTAQVPVPGAREGSGFTPLLAALIVTLAGARTVRQVAQRLGVSDGRVWRPRDHDVDTARAQEDCSAVAAVGLDATAARRGHHSISRFHDLEAPRLLFAGAGRKATVVDEGAEDLEAHGGCAEHRRNVGIDLSARDRAGIAETRPWAAVTCDALHVIPRVNQAGDAVHRQEATSTPELQRTRYRWLKDKHTGTGRQSVPCADLRQLNLQTHRACQIKEARRAICRIARSAAAAEPLLAGWYRWARRCRLKPMKPVATTLKDHGTGILNAFDSQLTNGRVEAINSLIQAAKAKARGYGTIQHLITLASRVAGKLSHLPTSPFNLKAGATPAA